MNARGRFVTAIATLAVVAAALAACSHAATGSGNVGQAGGTVDAGFGSAAPAPTPTSGGGTGGNGGNHGGGGSSAGASSSASDAPSSPGQTIFTFIGSDYGAAATGTCGWLQDGAGHLMLVVDFTISYSGLQPAQPVPWSVGDDKDSYHVNGTASAYPMPVYAQLGGDTSFFATSAWPGKTVTVTIALSPQGTDNDASDNTASVKVKVPTTAPNGTDLLQPLPCS